MTYNEQLIEMIRKTGEDLIKHAKEYAGGSDEIPTANFKITITLNPDTNEFNFPKIEVHRTYISESACCYKLGTMWAEQLKKEHEKEESDNES